MIPADLLARLQEADPELCNRWIKGLRLIDNYAAEGTLIDTPISMAGLQYCLQDAIRARGWKFILMTFTTGITPFAKIFKREPVGYSWNAHGDTEAEALGWAYLAAIEANRP